ncbi:MAG: sulfotransferase [Bacteroidetes bacterium]|nr:sulfotransferase [Bacteroidota bacterium]
MKNYLTAGIGFKRLVRLVRKNSISFHPRNLVNLLFLFQTTLWTGLFSWIERKRYGTKIASSTVPEDPIFIIGHWRTGTTLLHQLLNLDPDLAAPTLFQVAEPGCFISSYNYYVPVFSALLPENRPMDNVKIGMNEPQEDEYAIYRITGFSPIENLVFPKSSTYFLLDNEPFIPIEETERKEWERQLQSYFQKLFYFHGKTIVSKNPFNSMRIKELAALFPKARFIHIVRNPEEVVPSAIHMWKIVMGQNSLNKKGSVPGIEEVTEGLDKVLKTIERDKVYLREEQFFEMRFEDLESDPVTEIKKVYSKFNMHFNEDLGWKIISFAGSLRNYKKNEFKITDEEKSVIHNRLHQHMVYFNYH